MKWRNIVLLFAACFVFCHSAQAGNLTLADKEFVRYQTEKAALVAANEVGAGLGIGGALVGITGTIMWLVTEGGEPKTFGIGFMIAGITSLTAGLVIALGARGGQTKLKKKYLRNLRRLNRSRRFRRRLPWKQDRGARQRNSTPQPSAPSSTHQFRLQVEL